MCVYDNVCCGVCLQDCVCVCVLHVAAEVNACVINYYLFTIFLQDFLHFFLASYGCEQLVHHLLLLGNHSHFWSRHFCVLWDDFVLGLLH